MGIVFAARHRIHQIEEWKAERVDRFGYDHSGTGSKANGVFGGFDAEIHLANGASGTDYDFVSEMPVSSREWRNAGNDVLIVNEPEIVGPKHTFARLGEFLASNPRLSERIKCQRNAGQTAGGEDGKCRTQAVSCDQKPFSRVLL